MSADVTASAEALIASLPLFRNLKADGALRDLVAALSYREVAAGKVLVRQGDPADGMYMLLAGAAEVMADGRVLARLGAGEAFGEMGLFGDAPRSASVTALQPGLCAVLARDALDRVLARIPRLATNMMRALSERIRVQNGMLLAARIAPPAAPVPAGGFDDPITLLRTVPIFAGVTDERFLRRVAGVLQPLDVPGGERVFARGDAGDRLYLIVQGTARVHLDELALARLGPGSTVGEMALLDGEPRSADVTADTACRFLTLTQAQFFAAIAQSPIVARAMLQGLAERIRQGNRLVAGAEAGEEASAAGFYPETAGPSPWQRDAATGRWHLPMPRAAAEGYAELAEAEGAAQAEDGFAQAMRSDARALREALEARHAGRAEAEPFAKLTRLAEALVGRLHSPLSPRRAHGAVADALYDGLIGGGPPLTLRMALASPTALAEIGDFLAVAWLFRDAGFSPSLHLLAVRWENLVEARALSLKARRSAFRSCLAALRQAVDKAGFPQALITPVGVEVAGSVQEVSAPPEFSAAIRGVLAAHHDMTAADPQLARNLLWITGFYARQQSLRKLGRDQPLLDLGIRMGIGERTSDQLGRPALLLTSELNQRFLPCYAARTPIANIRLNRSSE